MKPANCIVENMGR